MHRTGDSLRSTADIPDRAVLYHTTLPLPISSVRHVHSFSPHPLQLRGSHDASSPPPAVVTGAGNKRTERFEARPKTDWAEIPAPMLHVHYGASNDPSAIDSG
jgi:hypothetical protein